MGKTSRRVRRYWAQNWQVKHFRLRKHQLTISQVKRDRSTAHPQGDQIGRVSQSWERAAGGSDFGLL